MLEAHGLTKSFAGGRMVLENLSLDMAEDETLAVVGPSGSGKTTLLYMLCGLSRPDAGSVVLSGRPVLKPRPDIAIILQNYGLLPWKTALDNVALGLKIQHVGRKERRERSRELMAQMGLEGLEKAYPACLSGGEQQRVAIARALAMNPRLLLMDEPFSSLDALTREKLQDSLLRIWRQTKVPYILVTHSVEEAVYLGKRILLLSGSPAAFKAGFENPLFGESGVRKTQAFYKLLQEVRQAMEDLW